MSVNVGKECCVSVLGLCCAKMQGEQAGVGKSSLCTRFVHPDADGWKDIGFDHSHWLSQTDFHEPEINGDHFVYFGGAKRCYCPRGASGAFSSESVDVTVHVVEHTTFCNDTLYRPFSGSNEYARRATADEVKPTSSGKVSYLSRSTLGDEESRQDTQERRDFPARFAKGRFNGDGGVDGYIFVLDPTAKPAERARQWQLWEDCWKHVPSKKKDSCVLVLSKCEAVTSSSGVVLDRHFAVVDFFANGAAATVHGAATGKKKVKCSSAFRDCSGKLAVANGKHTVPVFYTSSADAVGIDLPFLYLAHRALKLPGRPRGAVKWKRVLQMRSDLEKKALLATSGFLKTYVDRRSLTWKETMADTKAAKAIDCCRSVHGVNVCQAAFKSHLMALMMAEAERAVQEEEGERLQQDKNARELHPTAIPLRIRSKTSGWAREHPDLKAFVKDRIDSASTDYDFLHYHSVKLQSSVRAIVQRPCALPAAMAEAMAESNSDEDDDGEPIYEEIGSVAIPLLPERTIYESTKSWKKFDQRFTQSLEMLRIRPQPRCNLGYERLPSGDFVTSPSAPPQRQLNVASNPLSDVAQLPTPETTSDRAPLVSSISGSDPMAEVGRILSAQLLEPSAAGTSCGLGGFLAAAVCTSSRPSTPDSYQLASSRCFTPDTQILVGAQTTASEC